MQKDKGVTLITVTIYIIVMLMIVTIMTILTSYFYQNINISSTNQDFNQQYINFNSYFTYEINKRGNKIIEIQSPIQLSTNKYNEQKSNENKQNYILFSSGNQYTYIPDNKGIYMNKIKIAQNITGCIFQANKNENGKTTITVIMQGDHFERETTYTLID